MIRADAIYVQSKTKRRLRWIAKAIGNDQTADELGDNFINEVIEARYPQVIEAERNVNTAYEEAERRLQKALNGGQA